MHQRNVANTNACNFMNSWDEFYVNNFIYQLCQTVVLGYQFELQPKDSKRQFSQLHFFKFFHKN